MRRRGHLFYVLTVSILLFHQVPSWAQVEPDRPNFLFILIDDMGWPDVGCYGSQFHDTPSIDKLASQGLRMTNAYAACPVCSPTRASIVTGKYPANLVLTNFIPGHHRPFAKLLEPAMMMEVKPDEPTLADALQKVGYKTAMFGKWHMGYRNPNEYGFDESVVTGGKHFAPNFKSKPKKPVKPGTSRTEFLTDQAIDFMKRNQKNPFFVYLCYHLVHIPLEGKEDLVKKYKTKPKPKEGINNPVYAAMVEHVDQCVGKLMQSLDDLNLDKNTVVIFFSDNGGLTQRFDKAGDKVSVNTPLRDEKGSLYEGGVRVPLIVRWPEKIKAGRVDDTPVTSVDFYPTILHYAHADDIKGHQTDGVSLADVWLGTAKLKPRDLFWHYPHYHHTSPASSIRSGDYKLIKYYEDNHVELYDLKNDLGEKENLAKQEPKLAMALQDKLNAWLEKMDARYAKPNPKYDPKKENVWIKKPRPYEKPRPKK